MRAFKRHLIDALMVLILISLAGISWLAYSGMKDENESAQWETQTLVVTQKFGDLLSDLKDAETGQRGFIITGQREYLEPYHAGLAASPAHLAELRRLTADNPGQQQRLDAIAPLIAAKFAALKETIALRETQGFPAASAALMALSGKTLMDQLRGLVAEAQAEEARLLKGRSATTASDTRKARQTVALGNGLGAIALILLFIRLRWHMASRQRATALLGVSEQRLLLATDAAELEKERLRSILHQSPAGIVQTDATGCLTWMNDRWCQMLDYPEAEMVGRSVLEFTHPFSVEATATAFGALAAGGPDFQIDKHYSREDGTILAAQSNVSAIRSPSGDFLGITAVVIDMSERLRLEDALRQSEERFRVFVTASSDVVYRMSPDWREMRQLHGQDFIADTPAPNANWLQEYIHPDDQQRVLAAIDQAIQSKSLFEMEHQVVTVDGTLGWTCSRAVPMLDANGEIIEWFGTASNVTEHKRAQENLRLSEDRLKMAAAAGRVGIWDWNVQTNELIWDDAMLTLYGARREEFSGAYDAWSNRLHPDDKAASEAVMQDALAGKKDFALELSVVWPDGSVHHLIANARVVRDEAGKPLRVVGTNVDITERKQAEQALADLDQRKDEFLAMLGHELRNPLAALANAAQLLQLQKHEDPLQKQGLAIIERQVGQLKRLVDELLEVSRISTGSIRLRLEQISLGDVVERALETVRPLIAQHRHALERALAPEPIVLQCDPARLEQVLVNLLSNAAKYTDDGGQIWLGLEREGNAAVLRVRDTGIGIAPDLLPHIFDLFTQAERSLDRSQGGLGIGLSLVQRLVELHGGTVAAHSVVGQGSEFVVRLPLMQAPLAPLPAPTPDAAVSPEPQASGCQVLIVDDNVDAAETLGILLGITGHAVTLAHDGPSAVQAAIDGRPDVVLLDIGLPGFDGYEVAERIRQHAALQGVVLVALTGYGQDKDRQRSREAGFDHHLVKPVSFSDVKRILAEVAEMAG